MTESGLRSSPTHEAGELPAELERLRQTYLDKVGGRALCHVATHANRGGFELAVVRVDRRPSDPATALNASLCSVCGAATHVGFPHAHTRHSRPTSSRGLLSSSSLARAWTGPRSRGPCSRTRCGLRARRRRSGPTRRRSGPTRRKSGPTRRRRRRSWKRSVWSARVSIRSCSGCAAACPCGARGVSGGAC